MARKKQIDFPELGQLSTLDAYNLLSAGKKITRHTANTLSKSIIETKHKLSSELPKKKIKKGKRISPLPQKKKKLEEIVPPSSPEPEMKLNFLEGCLWGELVRNRAVALMADPTLQGKILGFEEVSGEDVIPVKYKVGILSNKRPEVRWVDITQEKIYLGGDVVSKDGQPWQVLWNFPPPQSYPNILLRNIRDSSIVEAQINEVKECSQEDYPEAALTILKYRTWINTSKNSEVDLDKISEAYFRYVRMKGYKKKVLLLRYHSHTKKLFIYKDNSFKWVSSDDGPITTDLTEPPVPFKFLKSFNPGGNMRKQFKRFFLTQGLEYPKEEVAEEVLRKESRCKVCDYIIDVLDYMKCSGCEKVYHTQCLDTPYTKTSFRNIWRCPDCPRCDNCLGTQGKFFRCTECNCVYHERCMDLNVTPAPCKQWKCEMCAVCYHCKITALEGGVKWNENVTKCNSCDSKWKKGEYCPVCEKFWFSKKGRQSRTEQRLRRDDDDMIQCDKCEKWVHFSCDTNMKQAGWSSLKNNESIKYFCPSCRQANSNMEMVQTIRTLMEMEKQDFFVQRFDDPHYNKVIKNQMYFEKMLENAEQGVYSSNENQLVEDFKLICENAMCYYKANTNGYQAAKKLMEQGMELLDLKFAHIKGKRKRSEGGEVKSIKKAKIEEVFYERPLPTLDLDLPTHVEKLPVYSFEFEKLIYQEEFSFKPPNDMFNIIILKKDIQPYLHCKQIPSFYPTPLAVTFTDPLLCQEELCYLCSSFIRADQAWICRVCSRAFHEFCIYQHLTNNKETWKCKDCRVCDVCKDTKDAVSMIYCSQCERAFDIPCLWPEFKGQYNLKKWICDYCFECNRCGAPCYHEPGFEPTKEDFYDDFSLCYKCSWVLEHKEYCPECKKDWTTPYSSEPSSENKYKCKYCEFSFHPECVEDWKGVCSKCMMNNMNFSQAEQATLQKFQNLISLVSQIDFYRSLCKNCIQQRYKIPADLAKELANLFLVENAEYMANSPEIRNLFTSRGVDILRDKCNRQPEYRLTTIPMVGNLKRSDVPTYREPIAKVYIIGEMLKIWDIEWDTSLLINCIDKIYTPLEEFTLVETFHEIKDRKLRPFVFEPFIVFPFEIGDLANLPKDNEQYLYDECEWFSMKQEENFIPYIEPEKIVEESKSPILRTTDINLDVLSQEMTSQALAQHYLNSELPAYTSFVTKFEAWLEQNVMKLVQHHLNKPSGGETPPPLVYEPTLPETPEYKYEFDIASEASDQAIGTDTLVPGDKTSMLKCVLCKLPGERTISGRLLPADDSKWVHANCAYWSYEVKEDEFGGLLNFALALSRGKKSKCKECGQLGATLNCISKRCHASFHFPCALNCRVQFYENKTILCGDCGTPKEMLSINMLKKDYLYKKVMRKIYITKGKKYSKKPPFVRNAYNRIGSIMLCEIPEEGLHEHFLSYRRMFFNNERYLAKCEKKEGVYRVTLMKSMEESEVLCYSECIEDLWPVLKQGYSFVLQSATVFFGYPLINHFLPPLPETDHYKNMKDTKHKPISEILADIKPSPLGSSVLEPYTKHRNQASNTSKIPVTNSKSVSVEESNVAIHKTEKGLSHEYRKYIKNPNRDSSLEILPSNIHGHGLFTSVDIPAGNIVIEYIGELIRNKVADLREVQYMEQGIGEGSCYLFRLDEDLIVDATVKGGKARFINHSCTPNCEAAVCEIDGHKHILLFAKRFIYRGEEIVYDYKFEVESEKIYCKCGASDCQGKLN